jgi:iron complex transport system substrate-binding protein
VQRCVLALALLALGGATACGERPEPVGSLGQTYPVTVRGAADQPTVVAHNPQRIVALGEGPAELLEALGVESRVVGGPAGATPTARVVVGRSGAVDIHALVMQRPDLVVATEEDDPIELDQIARLTRAAVYVQPGASVVDVERAAIDLGFLVGRPAEARRLAARIQDRVAQIRARLTGVRPVSVFVDTGFYTTVATRSLLGNLVQLAGGRSVAGERPGSAPFSPRRIARLDPDVYLATSSSDLTRASLRSDPEARRIPAVRRGRIAVLPAALVQVAGPRVAEGVAVLARTLHPDAFR